MGIFFCFFFQAEDGIRDHCVTGVQTCALPISPPLGVRNGGRCRRLRQLAGHEVVAQVTRRDVDHVAALSELVHVLQEDCLSHGASVAYLSATYGRSPTSRARLTAVASWDWWRRHAPVTRDERIFPLSLIARRSAERSL